MVVERQRDAPMSKDGTRCIRGGGRTPPLLDSGQFLEHQNQAFMLCFCCLGKALNGIGENALKGGRGAIGLDITQSDLVPLGRKDQESGL